MANTTIMGYQVDMDAMKSSTCGNIGLATKNGKTYFVKRFNNPVQPARNGTMSPKVVERNQKKYDTFVRRKTRLNRKLLEISGEGGNIIPPLDYGTYDDHWIEFSEYVEGAVHEDEYATTIAGLSEAERLLALRIAMGALATLHSHQIVHGDLKLPNVMLVRNSAGHYVSKIIDLDGAFFEDDVPTEEMTGTPDYYSPEQAIYCNIEDPEDREPFRHFITTKSDIFTMGLVLHEYLTGRKPTPDKLAPKLQNLADRGKYIYCWQALIERNPDGSRNQLVVSDQIRNPSYVALISDMLNFDAAQRPNASEVLARLTIGSLPISDATWSEDNIAINMDAVKLQYIGLKKVEDKDREGRITRGYEVIEKDGRRFRKTARDLIAGGFANEQEALDAPWPEDGFVWDETKIKTMFAVVRRGESAGFYKTVDRAGNSRLMTAAQLKMLRFAIASGSGSSGGSSGASGSGYSGSSGGSSGSGRSGSSSGASGTLPAPSTVLWPEDDGKRIDTAKATALGLSFVGRAELAGVKGYQFRENNGNVRFLTRQTTGMLKILVSA